MGKPQKRNLLHMALPCTGLPLIGSYFFAHPAPVACKENSPPPHELGSSSVVLSGSRSGFLLYRLL